MKVGDVVKLKAGGPPMTVSVVRGDSISCVWFEIVGINELGDPEYGNPNDATFIKDTLVEVSR